MLRERSLPLNYKPFFYILMAIIQMPYNWLYRAPSLSPNHKGYRLKDFATVNICLVAETLS